MASTFVNNLRLNELGTGDASGTWGNTTNSNLELIGEALAFGTEAITTNANTHATTVADGSSDAGRAMILKYTGTLDSACTITISPNTIKRAQFIHNGTGGSQNIIISQGSGANVTIPPGYTKLVHMNGAGSTAAVIDALVSGLNIGGLSYPISDGSNGQFLKTNGSGALTFATVTGTTINNNADNRLISGSGTANTLEGESNLTFNGSVLALTGNQTVSGNIDIDGISNLDAVDIDGAVNMATTLLVTGETTLQTHLNMGDGDIIKLGASADLTLKHDGSNSYISDTGTGTLIIEGSQIAIKKNGVDETMALFTPDAAATLYHNNAAKIATTATGVNVTGAVNIGGTGTANALDDYEEGSWTPSVGGNANYTQQFGRYTKIGNHITLQCVIIIGNAIGTGSASSLSGLPFAQESTGFSVGSLSISYMGANATSVIYPTGYVINNAATISFSGMNGANTTFQLNGFNMFTNTTHLQFSVSYRTA